MSIAVADDLKPFISDGCSIFPDGTLEEKGLWLTCCIEHDKAYWRGGTEAEKKLADEQLKSCVVDIGEPLVAVLMKAGVWIGGSPYLPTSFRWGYGWEYSRGYKPLTAIELEKINSELMKEASQ